MISVYKLKPKFQDLIRPLAVKLNKWGITPNTITVLAVVLSAFIGYSLYRQADYRMALLMVPFLYLLRMVLNALDGIIAKEFNKQSSMRDFKRNGGCNLRRTYFYRIAWV
jgi:CDP-diacylglycerol--glycerol-3-phosphate 3-phosphatidyltransferase